METIRIELIIGALPVQEKKAPRSYKFGYWLGKKFAKPVKPKNINNLFRDWSKDYSDLDSPTVIRKERKC